MSSIDFVLSIILIVWPITIFFIIRRMIQVIRFSKTYFKSIIMPYFEQMAKEGNGSPVPVDVDTDSDGNSNYYRGGGLYNMKLTPEQLKILENSFFNKKVELNPKRFKPATKKRISIIGLIVTLGAIGFFGYKVFWIIYDFIYLTFF